MIQVTTWLQNQTVILQTSITHIVQLVFSWQNSIFILSDCMCSLMGTNAFLSYTLSARHNVYLALISLASNFFSGIR